MDGYLDPIRATLADLRNRLIAVEGMFTDAEWATAAKKQADAQKDAVPGTTIHPSRMPAEPGLPIGNYDPETQGHDEATDKAIAAEVKLREDRLAGVKPSVDSKSSADDPDVMKPMKTKDGSKASTY